MGGTSGAIYAIFLNAVSNALARLSDTDQAPSNAESVKSALRDGLEELCKYTLARKGHRTLMDALIPFVDTLQSGSLQDAYQEARKGAESTRRMEAAMGRASYVGKDVFIEQGGVPDPGALGVVSVLRGMYIGLGILV